jgi:hypothetical protein
MMWCDDVMWWCDVMMWCDDDMSVLAQELKATGMLKRHAWKLEWVDEYGYLVPEALEPGSPFLRDHPHLIREWYVWPKPCSLDPRP